MTNDALRAEGPRPLIGLPACSLEMDGMSHHRIGDKYVRAVAEAAGGLPLVFPALEAMLDHGSLLERLDGLMFTGSPSNVHPSHYGEPHHERAAPFDEARDRTTLPLFRAAIASGLPVLAICRGFQELNVAYGGTLHARLQEVPGRSDHRRPRDVDVPAQYAQRHPVTLTAGGIFEALAGRSEIQVNSLHGQGIDRLAEGLMAEATAPDGTIEAVSVREAPGFALGVQWHPEYRPLDDAFSTKLFRAFGDAARNYAAARHQEVTDKAVRVAGT